MIYEFSGYQLNTDRHVLTYEGKEVSVEPQVFDLLRVLSENANTLVTKDQLIDSVWGGRIVSDATISARISAARVAVGDNGSDQNVIRTISRRGFEMVAEVTVETPSPSSDVSNYRQTIRYTNSDDDINIAWSSAGVGKPVLLAWHHLSHLERDWESPLYTPWMRGLTATHRVIRYDIRGAGLSDLIREKDTLDDHVTDMLAVADAAELDSFPVIGVLQNAAVAIKLASQYPNRVERLVLVNGYSRGRAIRQTSIEPAEHDPFISLLNSGGWGDPSNGFMRAWATMALPTASQDEITQFIKLILDTGTTEDALRQRALIDQLDVTSDLENVHCPTIVLHARNCTIHPLEEGRRLATNIKGAEFVQFDSGNAFATASDPSIDKQLAIILEFLDRQQ